MGWSGSNSASTSSWTLHPANSIRRIPIYPRAQQRRTERPAQSDRQGLQRTLVCRLGRHAEEQRVKFVNIAQHIADNPAYIEQVLNNQDDQNRRLAMEKLISQAVSQERKRELDLYKRYASDPDFRRAFDTTVMRILEQRLAA